MGDPRGFLKHAREDEGERPIDERLGDWREISVHAPEEEVRTQASRCMDCGIPFCHSPVATGNAPSAGCPLGNLIPEWNDLVYRGEMDRAAARLHETNNFPEVTGRVCPAPCEAACVLNIDAAPVTIKTIERTIADHAMLDLRPVIASRRTGQSVAVVGSGPAGMACAQELARKGHDVTLFERDDRIGGLLRYGIPDFKMEKGILDKRVQQMTKEGVRFVTSANVDAAALREFDAVVLALGARVPRDLTIGGRHLPGVVLAMDFLTPQNKRNAGDSVADAITATGKHVVVIGGGDTGSDCVGTSIRQGAKSVTQLELMPKPPLVRMPSNPWPEWPLVLRTSTSHEEGANRAGAPHGDRAEIRDWAVSTRAFTDEGGALRCIEAVRVKLEAGKVVPIPGSEHTIPCELALLAMGFTGVERPGLVDSLGVAVDARGNIQTTVTGATNVANVFAAGDASRGQSLVVWAIADGRRVAAGVDAHLKSQRIRTPLRGLASAAPPPARV